MDAESQNDRPRSLERLEYLGDATRYSRQVQALIPRCALLANFSPEEAQALAKFIDLYRAEPGAEILGQGEGGDFMLIVVEGRVETCEHEDLSGSQVVAELGSGAILGEIAMIDGEPFRITCVAVERTVVAVLHRERLARVILEQPLLGAKLLMELVTILSARLRVARARLLGLLEARSVQSQGARPEIAADSSL